MGILKIFIGEVKLGRCQGFVLTFYKSKEEIALKKCKKNKVLAPDKICIEIWKIMRNIGLGRITNLNLKNQGR